MSSVSFASQTLVGEFGIVDERILGKHRQLAGLPEPQLYNEAIKTLTYELDLPADERRRRVIGRLRAWLHLEPSDAHRIATVFDAALEELGPADRHTIRETEEDAVMDGLSYREFEQLAAIMPSLKRWHIPFWQDSVTSTGMPGSFAAALAFAGMTGEL